MTRLLVVGAGPPTRDGGVDLFLELMAAVDSRVPAEFAWVGARPRVIARRLDAETATLGMGERIGWRAPGSGPTGPGAVHVVTARTASAARSALAELAPGVSVLGMASTTDVVALLEPVALSILPYPDTAALAERIVEAARDPGGR